MPPKTKKKGAGGGGGTAGGRVTPPATTGPVSVDPTLPDQVARMPYDDLVSRRDGIRARLEVISVDAPRGGGGKAAATAGGGGSTAGGATGAKGRGRGRPSRKAAAATAAAAAAGSDAKPDDAPSSSSAAAAGATGDAADNQAAPPPPPAGDPPIVPYEPKTDVHWDFVMKEMMWLSTDFQSERKTQLMSARKMSAAVKQFHKSKESRRIRQMAEMELGRRRLANRMARDVRGWWTKVERVVAYKQKVNADASRRKAMDQHLVFLVKQTERYGKSLAERHALEGHANGGAGGIGGADGGISGGETSGAEEHMMTIEQALAAAGNTSRRSKSAVTNYMRVTVDPSDSELYGTSTADDSDDYDLSDEEPMDDVTTLVEAERMGNREEEQDEARKLQEESEMDIEQVLARLTEEAAAAANAEEGSGQEEKKGDDGPDTSAQTGRSSRRSRKVQFAPVAAAAAAAASSTKQPTQNIALRPRRAYSPSGHGSDADDDADASDVEDFDATAGDISDGSDEFEADAGAVDDETTLAAEERLGRDMSYQQEIDLLNQEAEMSVEQLRAMYMPQAAAAAAVEAAAEDEDMPDEDGGGDSSGSEEFVGDDRDGVDDETTLEAEERLGREMSAEDEINMLNREAEMSVEELRAMYAGIDQASEAGPSGDDAADDDDRKPAASAPDTGKRRSRSSRRSKPSAARTAEVETTSSRRSRRRASASANDEEPSEDVNDPEGEEEFQLQGTGDVDDETTLEAEERLGRDMSYQQEIDLLKRESEMSVEELRAMYAGMNGEEAGDSDNEVDDLPPPEPVAASSSSAGRRRTRSRVPSGTTSSKLTNEAFKDDDGAEEEEYQPDARAAVDNEDTLEAEERLGREMSPEEELKMLQEQNEVPIEELRAMYAAMENEDGDQSDGDAMSCEDADNPSNEQLLTKRKRKRRREEGEEETPVDIDDDIKQEGAEESKKMKTHNRKSEDEEEDATVDMLKALEESEAKARQTMVSRPFLLAPWVKLREYQKIGLNWLVSTQGRRLNGILADEMGKFCSLILCGNMK